MADLATAFRDRLVANGAVNAAVSTRIYWGVVPQGAALPYVRLHIISDPRPEHQKGYQGPRSTRIPDSLFATTFKEATRIGSNKNERAARKEEVCRTCRTRGETDN